MKDPQETYVYETPDGGDTVYRRRTGDPANQRELHSQSQKSVDLHASLKHQKLWVDIHRAANTDPVLKEMLDQIEVYWSLKNIP
jgi:hypothetical protein